MTATFFAVLAVVGILVYGDFGITWDEPGIHKYGNLLVDHYAPGGAWEGFWIFRFYGPKTAADYRNEMHSDCRSASALLAGYS